MVKRTVSFADYEEPTWEEYTGEDPPIGKWYTARASRAQYDKEADEVRFIFEITEGDFAGWGRAWYGAFDGDRKWKMHVALKALQGGQTKDVTLDWANQKVLDAWLAKQKPVRIKVGEYNQKTVIDRIAPLLEAVKGGHEAAKTVAPEPEVDEEDEPYTEEELAALTPEELVEILREDYEYAEEDLPKKSRRDRSGAAYKKALVDAVLEEQEAEEDGEEGDGEEGDAEPGDEEFDDGFDEDAAPEPEPEPAPAPRTRRSAAKKAAPAAAPAPAPAARTRRTRR